MLLQRILYSLAASRAPWTLCQLRRSPWLLLMPLASNSPQPLGTTHCAACRSPLEGRDLDLYIVVDLFVHMLCVWCV